MLIDIASDLHIHHVSSTSPLFFKNPSDLLVLAGDVAPFCYYRDLVSFFEKVSATWKRTLFVPGNHEFYGSEYFSCYEELVMFFYSRFPNIMMASNEVIRIDNINFISSILWSDMDKDNAMTKLACHDAVNDYHYIRFGDYDENMTPDDTINLFNMNVQFLDDTVPYYDNVVVITHHAPSYQSIATKYKGNHLNGAFASDLEYFIHDNPHILCWIHGHVHTPFDYMIGDTRVVCHPKGYPGENRGLYAPYRIEVEDK